MEAQTEAFTVLAMVVCGLADVAFTECLMEK
jgi:hypothetical protein